MSSLGISKEEFLESIQKTLGKAQREPPIPNPLIGEELSQIEERATVVRQRLASREGELLDRLESIAPARGWRVHRASTSQNALDYICSLAVSQEAELVVRSNQDVFQDVSIDKSLTDGGVQVTVIAQDISHSSGEELRQEMSQAAIGITGVDYAVAETGSVVLLPRRGLSRLVSLLPPVHVAIVRPQEVLESLDDLFLLQRLAYHRGQMGSYMNIITGPSRTADIEQTIVVGVHGPKEAHMVILGPNDAGAN